MTPTQIKIIVPIVLLVMVAYGTFYTVDESDQVLILEFGGKHLETVKDPGLHVKMPIMHTVTRYSKRLLRHDASPSEFLTRDKKSLVVDSYVRYRIANPLRFFQTLRDVNRANARLDAIISSSLREAVASHDQSEIITDKREPIMDEVKASATQKAREFGVEIVDVRIKRTDFPREIAESIFARMRAERNRISKRYRSEGAEEELKIKAQTDKEQTIILAEAKRQSEALRGQGDAEAIKIYAQSLGRDPEFFSFLRSLEVYRESLGSETRLVLSADSPLFRYLENPYGKARR